MANWWSDIALDLVYPSMVLGLLGSSIALFAFGLHWLFERNQQQLTSWTQMGSALVFHTLWLPVLLPYFWIASYTIHLNEPTFIEANHSSACLIDHHHNPLLSDEILLLLIPMVILFFWIWRMLMDVQKSPSPQAATHHPMYLDAQQKLQRIQEHCPSLQLQKFIVSEHPECAFVMGIRKAQIVLNIDWMMTLDDAVLKSALLHESMHIQHRDTLRFVMLNQLEHLPVGKAFLQKLIHLWRQARESYIDQAALKHGGDALDLAQSIVSAAKWKKHHPGPHSHQPCLANSLLKLRLELLMQAQSPSTTPSTANAVATSFFHKGQDYLLRYEWIFAAVFWGFWILFAHFWSWEIMESLHQMIEFHLLYAP